MVGSNVDQLLYTVKIITNKTNNTVITLGSWIVGSKKNAGKITKDLLEIGVMHFI